MASTPRPTVPPAPPESAKTPKVVIDFEDNRLLADLFGEQDANLALLEAHLSVEISSRGNRVAISGAKQSCDLARDVLRDLYDKLQRGLPVDRGEIEGALRLAESNALDQGDGAGVIRTRKRVVQPRSANQRAYVETIRSSQLVFAVGPAGTGKTFLAVAAAVQMMLEGKVDRLILSRPAVEAGESIGFLPGDMREKIDPYLRPLYDALHDMLPGETVVKAMTNGDIEVAPLGFMRGRTLANAFVILDEAQNTTTMQMKMFLTRLGENSRMVVCGDPSQVDLPMGSRSGLTDALDILGHVDGIGVVRFSNRDVVRHPLVTRVVEAYNARDAKQQVARMERDKSAKSGPEKTSD